MKISWPFNLIEEIAQRRVVLVLGSGVSATAQNKDRQKPSTWEDFLNKAKSLMKCNDSEIEFVDKMLLQNNFLMALQAIHSNSDPGEYGNFLKTEFARPNFEPSVEHKAIKAIDSKILITTNFDKIYDKLCYDDGYVICDHKDTPKIISNIKSPENVIIKAHGTIDDVDNIIFTGEQYYNAKREYPSFYKLLEALFMTNTAVFLGYSLSDPDINLVLENIIHTSSNSNPHYIVVKEGTPDQIKKHWQKTYNISCLEYGPNYEQFTENIEELSNQVLQFRAERRIP